MKNITMKLLSVVGALAFVFALSSCNQDMMEATYNPTNNDVTFAVSSAKFSLEGQALVVKIQRGVAKEDLTVNVSLTDPNGVYTLNSNKVNFAAGEYEKEISLTYNVADLQPVKDYAFSLSFNEAEKALAGYNKFTASAQMPLEYEEHGAVQVVGNYLGNGFQYKLYLAKYTNNYYMVENLLDSGVNMEFNVVDGQLNVTSPSMIGISGISSTLLRFPSKTIDVGVGVVNFLLDGDPAYILYQLGADGLFSKGALIQFDAVYHMNGGYYGWYKVQIHCL